MGLSVIGSIFNITGIAVNRYCYICHSFSYSRLYSYRNTMLFVALIWVLTVLAVMPNIFVGSLRYDPRVYSCTFAQTVSSSYTVAVVVVHFFVPIAVVTFCYLRIWVLVIQVSPLLVCLRRHTTRNLWNGTLEKKRPRPNISVILSVWKSIPRVKQRLFRIWPLRTDPLLGK